jgi:hypothetical protein
VRSKDISGVKCGKDYIYEVCDYVSADVKWDEGRVGDMKEFKKSMNLCDICKKNQVDIHVGTPLGENRHLCWECNNNLAAGYLGINDTPFQNGIYEYNGIRGKKHTFWINRIIHPVGIGYEADEIMVDQSPGFKVAVMDKLECDQAALFAKLEAKIKKTIFKRYLKISKDSYFGKRTIIKNDEIVGRFDYDESNDSNPMVVIDGKAISWDELGKMLTTYEGFQFALKIYDMTDDIK